MSRARLKASVDELGSALAQAEAAIRDLNGIRSRLVIEIRLMEEAAVPAGTAATAEGDSLLTLTQVAEWLQMPPATLRFWRHKGTGPRSFKLGKQLRYPRADVLAWLEEQEAGAD